ncbi:MAG: Chorismate synthase [Firmicutes bacterium]|nr:Chorismate synthase [candidate division NPL-UPA2 bacterium]
MLRFLTAGESHGPALTCIIEGLPAGIRIDMREIDAELARRQRVPGRGERMKIEQDTVAILSGMRGGLTLGSPLTMQIVNRDHVNWAETMHPHLPASGAKVTCPRPGHADYPGMVKYGFDDARNVLERASARETAMRTAIGAVARQALRVKGISIYGRVAELGPLRLGAQEPTEEAFMAAKEQPFSADANRASAAEEMLAACRAEGVSVGGVIEVAAFHLPIGLGSYVHANRRLDGLIAGALMSIPAVRGVEIGEAFSQARHAPGAPGDSLQYDIEKGIHYVGNANAGLAGGMSTGQPLLVRCAVKPIPTLAPSRTVDLATLSEAAPVRERSDVTAVFAAVVVAEAVLAWVLLCALVESPAKWP